MGTTTLVNIVNTAGVMGKGIALHFKKAYPNNFKAYYQACKNEQVEVGELFVTKDTNVSTGEKIIILSNKKTGESHLNTNTLKKD